MGSHSLFQIFPTQGSKDILKWQFKSEFGSKKKWFCGLQAYVAVTTNVNSKNNNDHKHLGDNVFFFFLISDNFKVSQKSTCKQEVNILGNSLVVHWLGLSPFTAEGLGSIPGQWTKISQAAWHGQKQNKWTLFTSGAESGIQYYYHCHKIPPFLQPLSLQPLIKIKYSTKRTFPLE